MRASGDGRWREIVMRRVRSAEPKDRRRVSDPKSGLMLLGEQVEDATTE